MNSFLRLLLLVSVTLVILPFGLYAQGDFAANFDESEIPAYQLPDPLLFNDGKVVRNSRQWTAKRRAEIIDIFSNEMYGYIPAKPDGLHFSVLSQEQVFAGKGIRKVVRIYLDKQEQHWFDVLIHLPAISDRPSPMFVGLNFKSNEATLDERATSRWPYEMILEAGMGVATAWRDAVEPDGISSKVAETDGVCHDGGVRAWYNKDGDWGAISAWSWGLSRIMDYLQTDPSVDKANVALIGHSRLGKTALWAGANDTRFAAIISNDSGCCGAALSRRVYGENFAIINRSFPHWFTKEFAKYMWKEEDFPADQHWLAALAAPRPLYVASATEDLWADPKGEWLSAFHAGSVYVLFGMKGLPDTMPAPDTPEKENRVGYHLRSGKHDITTYDWQQYIDFFKRNLNR